MIGQTISHYKIIEKLGEGGMGVVYKAEDTKLDRTVALKFLASHLLNDGEAKQRFLREAKAAASLHHANICPVYEIDDADGQTFISMGFIEGETLEDRIAKGPLPVKEALDIGQQIAKGLRAAHEKGIVHRDIKPANVLVAHDGQVTIMDFGLARLTEASRLTKADTTMGTMAYMSPEQAQGMEVDQRTDIWALGVVLYEMIAGLRPFQGQYDQALAYEIVHQEPQPLTGVRAGVPLELEFIVGKCLAKDPGDRTDAAQEVARELRTLADKLKSGRSTILRTSGLTGAVAAAAQGQTLNPAQVLPADSIVMPRARQRLLLGLLAMSTVTAAALAVLHFTRTPTPVGVPDLSAYQFTSLSRAETEERSPRWSPDGKSIAYTARIHGVMQAFTRMAGAPDAVQLTKATQNCFFPFWPPNGASVYYMSGGSLWSVPAAGGSEQIVMDGVDFAAIHPDGQTLAFNRNRKLWIGSLNGGQPKEFWPGPTNGGLSFSPDGSMLAVGSIGPIWFFPFPSGMPRKVDPGGAVVAAPSWFPDSRHVAVAVRNGDGTILSIIDAADGTQRTIASAPTGFPEPSVSPEGKRIAYAAGQFGWDVLEISLPEGQVGTLISGGVTLSPDWAPSGTHFIFSVPTGVGAGIEDRQAGVEGFSRRLVEGNGSQPQWSPDGNRFVYYSEVNAASTLTLANASGGGSVLLDSTQSGQLRGLSWSPDGQWISYLREISGKHDLAKIRATPGAAPETVANAKPQPWQSSTTRWSPIGDWIAYPAADGIDLVSPDGKSTRNLTSRQFQAYNFSRDGSRLYGIFQNTTGNGAQWQLYSVDVESGAATFLAPIDLPPSVVRVAGFSIHPDGKRFLTSVAKFPFDIWMLEGFEQPKPKNWLDRVLRR